MVEPWLLQHLKKLFLWNGRQMRRRRAAKVIGLPFTAGRWVQIGWGNREKLKIIINFYQRCNYKSFDQIIYLKLWTKGWATKLVKRECGPKLYIKFGMMCFIYTTVSPHFVQLMGYQTLIAINGRTITKGLVIFLQVTNSLIDGLKDAFKLPEVTIQRLGRGWQLRLSLNQKIAV